MNDEWSDIAIAITLLNARLISTQQALSLMAAAVREQEFPLWVTRPYIIEEIPS